MKKEILLCIGTICLCGVLLGCGSNHDKAGADDESLVQNGVSNMEEGVLADTSADESGNQTENANTGNAEDIADTFGILISLPENPNWIADSEYYLVDENNLRITYHDAIADTDCTLLAAKNGDLNLPQNEYDETLDEAWEGHTANHTNVAVKVRYEKNDEKTVLATWEYNEYQFAIMGEDETDSKSIPKAALHIISGWD